ncbi:MAG: hypothetical protein LBP37_06015 [Spirochaetaceae bacterium]|jgi:hypothetical protein|nr:hypothetical protein [Spirochaetaceae bacterium]
MSRKPVVLFILTAYLAFTAIYAESYIFTHIHHEHNHSGRHGACSVCDEMEFAQALLEGFGRIAIAAFLAGFIIYAKKQLKIHLSPDYTVMTPVTLKVRLNT